MRVTIFDYGAGNLHSLAKALEQPGVDVRIEPDPLRAIETDALVLPGVGAFAAAVARLADGRQAMRDAIDGGLPTLGICLGMQLLFDRSEEGPGAGLGVIPGDVYRLRATRVPHIGWNTIDDVDAGEPLFRRSSLGIAYFANSYACRPADAIDPSVVTAWTSHEDARFAAAVRLGSAVGVQFHPEKSPDAGVAFVRGFIDEVRG